MYLTEMFARLSNVKHDKKLEEQCSFPVPALLGLPYPGLITGLDFY